MLTPIRLPSHIDTVRIHLQWEEAGRGDVPRHQPGPPLSPLAWVRHLNRLATSATIVFTGGEPVSHPHFYPILEGLRRDLPVEIETHLEFDVGEWLERVEPERFDPRWLNPALRVRFDPRRMEGERIIERALLLQGAGFAVALRAVLVPERIAEALAVAERARRAGLDATTVPFIGWMKGRLLGQYRYPTACTAEGGKTTPPRTVLCRSRQLIIGPDGALFACRRALLEGHPTLGRLSQEHPALVTGFRPCSSYGRCHPEDVALEVDRRSRFAPPRVEIIPLPRRLRSAS